MDGTCAAIFSDHLPVEDTTAGYLASLLAQIAYDNMADNRRVTRAAASREGSQRGTAGGFAGDRWLSHMLTSCVRPLCSTWEDTADALLRTWGCTATHFISEHVADQVRAGAGLGGPLCTLVVATRAPVAFGAAAGVLTGPCLLRRPADRHPGGCGRQPHRRLCLLPRVSSRGDLCACRLGAIQAPQPASLNLAPPTCKR